jgi:hypothetical protein
LNISDWLATLGVAVKKNENSPTTLKPALIQTCQEGGTLTTNPVNRTPTISQRYSRDLTPTGHALSKDMGCRLLDDGSADAPVTMPSISPFLTPNSTDGPTPPLNVLTFYLPLVIHDGTSTSATTPAYSYNGCRAAATSSMKNTTNRRSVAWKQQPEEGVVLRSVTMPIKNFFLSSSLAPARSPLYLRPAYATGMSLNCNHSPSSVTTGMSLNCTTSDHRSTTGMSLNCTTRDPRSPTSTSLNCTSRNSRASSGTTLNCTSLVLDPTPGTALNCNLGHLGHLGNISDLGHLGHLGYLGNIGNLDTLDPYPLDPAPTDSLPGAFITEMDPTDLGPSEDCYADDSLRPLHTRTLETDALHKSDALDGHGPTSGLLIDALDGHGSFSEI